MSLKLNQHETAILSTFRSLTTNNVSVPALVDSMLAQEQQQSPQDINWLKIAITLNSKKLVDAVFSNYHVSEKHMQDALEYGATHNSFTSLSTAEHITKKKVDSEFEIKHAQQSPTSNLMDSQKSYSSLTTMEYLTEKCVDFFKKRTEKSSKIEQVRAKYLASTQKEILKP